MTLLSKTATLAENDLKSEDIEVPEWGGAVRVRSFTGRERDAFEASMVRGDGKDRKVDLTNMRARLVGLTVIDEKRRQRDRDLGTQCPARDCSTDRRIRCGDPHRAYCGTRF